MNMDYENGSALLLYVSTGTPEAPSYKLIAGATSHNISTTAETKSRSTKDASGKWKGKTVIGLSQTIKCDTLVSLEEGAYGYDQLLSLMKSGNSVHLRYSKKEQTLTVGDKYEEGNYVITSLERTDPANEDSTMSATFESDGEIATSSKSV